MIFKYNIYIFIVKYFFNDNIFIEKHKMWRIFEKCGISIFFYKNIFRHIKYTLINI